MSPSRTRLAVFLAPELVGEARELIAAIRGREDPRELRTEGAEMVLRLTEAGLDAFFLEPVRSLGVGAMTQSMVKMGLASASKAIGFFIRRIVGGLSGEQIVQVAELIDAMLVEVEPGHAGRDPTKG